MKSGCICQKLYGFNTLCKFNAWIVVWFGDGGGKDKPRENEKE